MSSKRLKTHGRKPARVARLALLQLVRARRCPLPVLQSLLLTNEMFGKQSCETLNSLSDSLKSTAQTEALQRWHSNRTFEQHTTRNMWPGEVEQCVGCSHCNVPGNMDSFNLIKMQNLLQHTGCNLKGAAFGSATKVLSTPRCHNMLSAKHACMAAIENHSQIDTVRMLYVVLDYGMHSCCTEKTYACACSCCWLLFIIIKARNCGMRRGSVSCYRLRKRL
jgi:hypothetical protein